MANLCQTDYERVRPTEYFPDTFRDAVCDACGDWTFVARTSKAEAGAASRLWIAERQRNDPGSFHCPCGWSRIILDGETIEDARNAHMASMPNLNHAPR